MTSRLPHQWLRFGIPIALLVTTVILYQQEALAAALSDKLPDLTSTIVNNIYGTFHRLDTPIQKTIWRSVPHDEYLAVCLFARDQAADMVEWFQHHYFEMGIRRFYVMDDGSDPPLSTFMNDYGIPEEAVDFIHYEKSTDVPQGAQLDLYNSCARTYGVNNTWIAFIDADEFFDTPGTETIEDILRGFEETRPEVGALGVNWQMHTSNHQLYRAESIRKTYLECIYDDPDHNGEDGGNKHVKSIVRVDAYGPSGGLNPHMFTLNPGRITVGENGDIINSHAFRQPITRDRISLHHYVTKSFEDYYDKITRSGKTWAFWDYIEYTTPHVSCTQMLKYFPKSLNQPNGHH